MSDCGEIRALLPEYLAGRNLSDRHRIEAHLDRCVECNLALHELEAVFSLLSACEDPPGSDYGEANARLLLQTAVAPGPVRSNELFLRSESFRLRICSALSLMGTSALASSAFVAMNGHFRIRWNLEPMLQSALTQIRTLSLWEAVALFSLVGGMASVLPILVLNTPAPAPRRPMRREV